MRQPHELSVMITGKSGNLVYQRVGKGRGNIDRPGHRDLQMRRHVIPTDYKTEQQRACRARIAAATLAWQQLTEDEKATWRKKARHRKRSGFNLFVRAYCKTNPV